MYAATPEAGNPYNSHPLELGGVRGGHVGDATDAPPTAWETTLGRPDVLIAVHDSGIKWNDAGAMNNLRFKTWVNPGEVPAPNAGRNDGGSTTESLLGGDCAGYTGGVDDANGDEVFNLADFACDTRVNVTDSRRVGPAGMLTPQDLLLAFTNGDDADDNGFEDDMVGWDFLDDDNDPYDDVQYGHGTGEAQDSTAEANNGGELGTCPNCMSMHMRVGDSFIADVNRFAQGVLYATDNGAHVIQEALGTLNNSRLSRQAVNYAYKHGVTVIASAADEAAQHNNWPSSLPHVILVNSVTQYDDTLSPLPRSYLQFNGCTNFNAKITVAIPSVSCSSDATGRGSGMAGLIYSAALNAVGAGEARSTPASDCERAVDVDGTPGLDPCLVTANEVRQLMASGAVGGTATSDDVDFLAGVEPFCGAGADRRLHQHRRIGCTGRDQPSGDLAARRDPKLSGARRPRPVLRLGPGQHGQGDRRADPRRPRRPDGQGAAAAGGRDHLSGVVRPDQPRPGDLRRPGPDLQAPRLGSLHLPGADRPGSLPEQRRGADRGLPADRHRRTATPPLTASSPASASPPCRHGSRPEPTSPGPSLRRPLSSTTAGPSRRPTASRSTSSPTPRSPTRAGSRPCAGEDRRAMWLHRDTDMLTGFPRKITENSDLTGDGESSPALADLDGDNRTELIVGSSDGFVHAFRRNGTELPGWPVRGDAPGFLHTGGRAYSTPDVSSNLGGAMLSSVAVGDTDRNGIPEVWAADFEGKVYGWSAGGQRIFTREANIDFSGKPLSPFQNVRNGEFNRTQHGFIGSPVLADIDGDRALEIVAANMDRHLYAWDPNGSSVPGYPLLVVDMTKVASIDPTTHRITFNANAGSEQQGAIVDTPAVGDLDGDANDIGPDELPEIVVGTNEEYSAGDDGGLNADSVNAGSFTLIEQAGLLEPGNGRLYAVNPGGDPNPDPDPAGAFRAGWPAKIGIALTGLLPVVGEGITAPPIIGPVACEGGAVGPKVGVIPNNGFAYVFNPNGQSCYGRDGEGRDTTLQTNFGATAQKYDTPVLAAVGSPAFGALVPGASPSFLSPAAGVIRAVDLGINEYQGGQDFLMAWNSETAQPQPGFPGIVNDLQFLTGPSVADIDAVPNTEEVVGGTASFDLAAFSGAGTPVPGFPKLTGDWTVASPAIGSFGTLDAGPGSTNEGKALIGLTRSGYLFAYDTDAAACTPSSWPRFHHDNANSGDYSRDAVLPGKPTDPMLPTGTTMSFVAPGEDLMCANADRYEIVTSNSPIDESNFDSATRLCGFGGRPPIAPSRPPRAARRASRSRMGPFVTWR